MPRFYEEAAHLLLVLVTNGVTFAPGTDHPRLLSCIAALFDQFIKAGPTHADAAHALLDLAAAQGMAPITPSNRVRMIALVGTMIGNVMTMHGRR